MARVEFYGPISTHEGFMKRQTSKLSLIFGSSNIILMSAIVGVELLSIIDGIAVSLIGLTICFFWIRRNRKEKRSRSMVGISENRSNKSRVLSYLPYIFGAIWIIFFIYHLRLMFDFIFSGGSWGSF